MIELYIKKYPYEKGADKLGHTVAYGMLEAAYREKFNTPPPKIAKTDLGKPFFTPAMDGDSRFFNISHSRGYAAVLLTDMGECGVDIEPDADSRKMEKIKSRFLNKRLKPEEITAEISVRTEGFSDGLAIEKYSFCDESLTLAVAEWTILEAVLKADGRGFSAFGEGEELAKKMQSVTFKLTDGVKSVYLTAAIKK